MKDNKIKSFISGITHPKGIVKKLTRVIAAEKFKDDERFLIEHQGFAQLAEIAEQHQLTGKVNGILLDLGVSSMQLSSPERGFSFKYNSPLDMRMNKRGEKAYDLINSVNESSLADIIFRYGEERKSRKIAKEIVKKRKVKKISTTSELSEIITSVVRFKQSKIHPATKTFQAIRIHINNELEHLTVALEQASNLLHQNHGPYQHMPEYSRHHQHKS